MTIKQRLILILNRVKNHQPANSKNKIVMMPVNSTLYNSQNPYATLYYPQEKK